MKRIAVLLMMVLTAPLALAIDTDKAFDDPGMQARYDNIIAEVRCVQCQNQTIRDSNAMIARDLRREIRRLLTEGKSDAEVYDFLVQRYGEFVLYRPRMSGASLLLWLAPGIFLVVGAVVVFRILRKRMTLPIDDDTDVVATDQ
jgi:cytochrome c-type biogenesis protein CcmH